MTQKTAALTAEQHTIRIGMKGRLVLPSSVRKKLHLREGDRMLLKLEPDGTVRLINRKHQVAKTRGIYKHLSPEVSLVDQLIQERRAEAQREQEN